MARFAPEIHAEAALAPAPKGVPSAAAGRRTIALLRELFGSALARDFSVRLWDGTHVPAGATPTFTLAVNAPHGLRAALTPPLDLNPARAFIEGWIDLEGDLEAGIDALLGALQRLPRRKMPGLLTALLGLPKPPPPGNPHVATLDGTPHSKERDGSAIRFHYDRSADFYRSFLDDAMVYSCGYYDDGVSTLAEAQTAKIDHILRKVRLQPGETLLDIGCGFGALLLRAAQQFGAKAVGITLSRDQYREALGRAASLGLEGRVSVELCDYRELGAAQFDKIASVGMAEHVGRGRLDEYFSAAFRALRPGGVFLNHAIAQLDRGRSYRASGFMGRYIFPDGELVSISEMLTHAERAGFEVRDVENLREHYARTLRAWLGNLECNRGAALAASDPRTYRAWRLYLAGSAQGFARCRMGVYQTLLAKPNASGATDLPATRRHLYAEADAGR